ncbi:MAG: S1/P1 nuclease [Hyphomonadaceae bacterium]|nr:S1/P1 nuclease [Hyphomonadaceae bacterium]
MARLAFLCVLLMALLAPAPARAWSAEGHRLIAALAYGDLNPHARAEVDRLIAADAADPVAGCAIASFADAAVWSDCVRAIPSFRNQSAWHYDNIPVCGPMPLRPGWCSGGDCASAAIERAISRLQRQNGPQRERLRALARLVHMIGDIHQPLHAADNGDRGGNDVQVRFSAGGPEQRLNLHSAWDRALVDYTLAAPGARARIAALMGDNGARWGGGEGLDWARQSNAIARDFIYARWPEHLTCGQAPTAPVLIDRAYAEAARPVIETQLARASLRLAATLNRIWP